MTTSYKPANIPPILLRHRLRIAREHAGLDQEQLAAQIGVARNTISNAELGNVKPRRITIKAWALACGVPDIWLTDGLLPREDSNLQPFDQHSGKPISWCRQWVFDNFSDKVAVSA